MIKVRLWCLPEDIYCSKHRNGIHYECHKAVGAINKGKSIRGYVERGFLDVFLIKQEHDKIAKLINHKSPLPEINYDNVPKEILDMHRIDQDRNLKDLLSRCVKCNKRYEDLK